MVPWLLYWFYMSIILPPALDVPRKPGIYRGLGFAEYLRIPAVSRGFLWTMKRQSAAHAQTPKGDSEALGFGRALHEWILTPELFMKNYGAKLPGDRRKKENRWIKDLEATLTENGITLIDPADLDQIKAMTAAVQAHNAARLLLDVPLDHREVSIVWTDAETGLLCKARADVENRELGCLPDLKTTGDASPDGFRKSVWAYGYHFQGAWYTDGFSALGLKYDSFPFVAVEKEPPYGVAVYELEPAWIDQGRTEYREQLNRLAELKAIYGDGPLPAYPDEVMTLTKSRN